MNSYDVVLVTLGTFLGFLRWAFLIFCILFTLYLIDKKKKVGKLSLGLTALLITVLITPILLLDFIPRGAGTDDDGTVVPDTSDFVPTDDPSKPSNKSDGNDDNNGSSSSNPSPSTPSETLTEEEAVYRSIDIDGASVNNPSSDGKYQVGKKVTIRAEDRTGYHVVWFANNEAVNDKTDNPLEFTMPDEDLSIHPMYVINQYSLTIEHGDYVVDDVSGRYDYQTPITVTAKNRESDRFYFEKWVNQDNEAVSTDMTYSFTIPAHDTTLYPVYRYDDPFPVVWNMDGTCAFRAYKDDGGNNHGQVIGDNCIANIDGTEVNYAGREFIDTGISLYNSENIGKDYEVAFDIDHFVIEEQLTKQQETIFTDKGYSWKSGVVFRAGGSYLSLTSRVGDGNAQKQEVFFDSGVIDRFYIMRYDGNLYYRINNSAYILVQEDVDNIQEGSFDISAWFGAAPDSESGDVQKRFITGVLSNISIRLGNNSIDDFYKITFSPNGGSLANNEYYVTAGTAIGDLPKATRSKYALVGWFDSNNQQIFADTVPGGDTTYTAKWISSIENANLADNGIKMVVGEEVGIRISNLNSIEPVSFSSNDSSVATVGSNTGVVTAVGEGETDIVITGTYSEKTRTVHIVVYSARYTVHFDAAGGSAVSDVVVYPGQKITPLPRTTRDGFTFLGWYTETTGGDELTENTLINQDGITYHARWDEGAAEVTLVCKKAETLHTETCDRTSGGCFAAGYSGSTVTYGSLPSTGAPGVGDAYDCDVNGDNKFNSETERFYYVATNGQNGVLVYYANFKRTEDQDDNIYSYSTALEKLPNTSEWANENLVSIDGKPSRFLTKAELSTSCEASSTAGSLDGCTFLLEKSRFTSETLNRSGYWLQQSSNKLNRVYTPDRAMREVNSSSNNAVRPAIEVPLEYIQQGDDIYVIFNYGDGRPNYRRGPISPGESVGDLPVVDDTEHARFLGWYTASEGGEKIGKYWVPSANEETYYAHWDIDTYTVEFDSNGGSIVPSVTRKHGEALGTHETEHEGHDFGGWYTGEDGTGTKYEADTPITSNVELHAKWTKKKYNVTFNTHGGSAVSPNPKEYSHGDSLGNISTSLDGYDFKGWYTGENGTGTKYNSWSSITAAIELHAYFTIKQYTVTFVTGEGSEVSPVTRDHGAALGEIESTRSGYKLEGWYTGENGTGDKYESDSVITSTLTLYANWEEIVYVCKPAAEGTLHTSKLVSDNSDITYGTIPVFGVDLAAGNAFDCDINNDGDYDSDTERFYYLETVDDNAVFIFFSYTTSAGVSTAKDATTDGPTLLPSTSVWKNSNITIRLPKRDDYVPACGQNYSQIGAENALLNCNYVLERTSQYAIDGTISSSIKYPSAYWLQPEGSDKYRVHSDKKRVTSGGTSNGTKPVIEVPIDYVKLPEDEGSSSDEVVPFDITNNALKGYYQTIDNWLPGLPTFTKDTSSINNSTWGVSKTDFLAGFQNNFESNDCNTFTSYYGTESKINWASGSTDCSKPASYNTETGAALNVYLYDETTDTVGAQVPYTLSDNGYISNMVPGQAYYWEKDGDNTVYGFVKATAEKGKRFIDAGGIRNVRDLGGMSVDINGDGTVDGTLKYELLYRGERLKTTQADVDTLSNLGIVKEYDLAGSGELSPDIQFSGSDYVNDTVVHYVFESGDNYTKARKAVTDVMNDIIQGNPVYFHCRVGADRTGTLAYLLEGLLGVVDEERYQDYELTHLAGLEDRTRYYSEKTGGQAPADKKFMYMMGFALTNYDIYNWFIGDHTGTDKDADDALISQFRAAMIDNI